MKRFLYFLAVLSICFISTKVWGQSLGRDILLRWDNNGQAVRGDFVQIGNHGNGSATLKISGHSSCLRVKWAGIYWASTGGMGRQGDNSTYNATLRLPNGQSVPLRADERMTTVFGGHEFLWNSYKDVTSIIQGLGAGFNNAEYQLTYSIGGWSIWNLVVVYEDINASTSKRVYVYDGCLLNFYNYNGVQHKTIPITGFQTPPAPAAVKARIGVCTGAGNINSYDILEINGHKQGQGSYPNAYEDFMDASISFNHSEAAMPRNPVVGRGQGFADLDVFDIPNPGNTVIKNGDTSLNIHFAAEDAYITYTVPFSVDALAPHVETHKEVLGLEAGQWKDFTGKTTVFGESLKYRLKFRNIGNDNVRDAVLEDLLPKGVTYENFEALPSGVTFVSATPNYNNTGRTLVKFNISPSLLQYSPTAPFSAPITINVKVQPDCANLIDFCSNEFKNQAEMVYHAALDNKEYRTGSFASTGGTCDQNNESATTFFVKDDTCATQDLPYCGGMTLKGGAGFAAWKWTKEGQSGVLATTQDLPISAPGTYIVERTPPPGGNRCNNKLTIKYVVSVRTGENLHPMRNAHYVTERKTCNITGIEYLGVGVCGTTQQLTITNGSLSDGQVLWYRYKNQRAAADCPPEVNTRGIQNDANWELKGTGKNFDLTPNLVDPNGSEFAVLLNFANCPTTYHFRAYKGELDYRLAKENILCGNGKIKVSNIPTGTYQYKVEGPAGSSSYQDIAANTTAFDIPVTQGGRYKISLRAKVTEFQENVCVYTKTIDVEAVADNAVMTLTEVEEVKCVSHNPATGKMRVVLNSDITLPVQVTVKKGTQQITSYRVTNTTEMNSDLIPAVKNVLYSLSAGNDYSVTVTPTYKSGCTPTISNFEITQIPELKINNASAKTITCGLNKVFTITVQGGKINPIAGRYSFIVKDQAGATTYEDAESFESEGGTPNVQTYTLTVKDPWAGPGSKVYKIYVYDQNNCEAAKEVTYNYQEKPVFNLTKVVDAICGPSTGSLKVDITNSNFNAAEYTIVYKLIKKNSDGTWPDWNSPLKSQGDPTFTGLTSGDYRARIYYTKGTVTCNYPEDCITYNVHGGGTRTECNPPHTDPKERKIENGAGPIRAFAGVVQLPCETPANSAEILVANVSGGMNTQYEYKLDGGTWGTNKRFQNIAPGTHTVSVRNKVTSGPYCEWTQTLQVPAPIARPTLTGALKYDCEGRARMEVTTDKANYSYTTVHTPTHGANAAALPTTPNSAFTSGSVPPVDFPDVSGAQTVRVFYKETASPNPIILLKEDFGQGENTCDSNVYSAYACKTDGNIYDGAYVIVSRDNTILPNGCWTTPVDHTGLTRGRYLAMNVGSIGYNKPIYTKVANDVDPNQPIKFKMYVYNLCHCTSCAPPLFQIRVVDPVTGNNLVPPSATKAPPVNGHDTNAWHEFSGELQAPGVTSLRIEIVSMSPATGGNDLALDDIYVYQEPKACPSSYIDLNANLESSANKKLKITALTETEESCNGKDDGKIEATVANYGTNYKWRVVKRGTSTIVKGTLTSTNSTPVLTVEEIAPGLYTLIITDTRQPKYADNQACEVTKDFEIKRNPLMQVTQNKTEAYLNCDVDRDRLVVFGQNDGTLASLFNITGGKQQPSPAKLKYTIKVEDLQTHQIETLVPENGIYRYSFKEGRYKITIVDDHNCNNSASYNFEMKLRNRLASISVAYTANCDPTTGIGDMTITPTWVGAPAITGNGGTLKYQWRKKTESTWSAPTASNVIQRSTIAGWEKGVPYVVRARDEYICGAEKEVTVYAPISDLLTADIVVVQPIAPCPPATTATDASITVNRVRSGNPSPSYQYAFVQSGNTPTASDYTASNTKTPLAAGRYDIYVKDVNVVPETCGKKVASNVVINGQITTGIDGGSSPITTVKSAYCENQGGQLIIQKFWGKGPFRVEVERTSSPAGTETYNIPRTAVPGLVTIDPATPPNVGKMTVTNYKIENLIEGSYKVRIYDEGNGDCQLTGSAGYTFAIAGMTWNSTVSKLLAPAGACSTNQTNRHFAVKVTHDATPASDYEVVYRLVKKNGARITTPSPWQRESTTADANIAGSADHAIFTSGKVGETYEVEAALVRKKTGAYSDTDVLCTTNITGIDLSRPAGTLLTLTPSAPTGCGSTYNLTVSYGQNATNLQFFLNHDGAPAEDQSSNHSSYTAGTTHTFNNLTSGRTYVVYARYWSVPDNSWCSEHKTITGHGGASPYTFGTGLTDHVANTCSNTQVKFKLTVSGPAPLNFKIYKKNDNNGALTHVGTVPLASATVIGGGYEIPFNYSVSAPSETFVISVEQPAGCEWMSPDIVATPTPANALTAGTLSVVASRTTPMSCADGKAKLTITGAATGGVGPFTFSFFGNTSTDPAKNTFLRRNIQVRNVPTSNGQVEFDFKESDFIITGSPDTWWKTTFPTLQFNLRITDQSTGCDVLVQANANTLGDFANSKHKAEYEIAINSTGTGAQACDNTQQNYKLKITLSKLNAIGATGAQPTDYEYSIDGGVTYTTFSSTAGPTPGSYITEVDIPVFFDHNKVKVRYKKNTCESTLTTPPASLPGTNERLTYPKLAFAATKTQDVACDAAGNYSAKFKAVITNGTDFVTPPIVPPAVIGGGNRYEIKVTYRTANTQENRVSGTFAAPAGSTLVTGSSPADTSVHNQDITVALPAPTLADTKLYYTVWIKDKGNKYCTDYIPSAPMEVLPAEHPDKLKARHKIEAADIQQEDDCTGGTGTKGSFEFTRNTTPASPAIAREDVRFEYDLQRSNIGANTFTSTGRTITDTNIIPNRNTDPTGTIRYRVEGLDEGDYRLVVKKSSNGECGVYNVTNISVSSDVVRINKNRSINLDVTTSSPASPTVELVQMSCDQTPSSIMGLIPATDKAQLKFKIKGGVPPYTAEVLTPAGVLLARKVINSSVSPLPYPALTTHEGEHTFDLPDTGVDYDIVLKIKDSKGCELKAGGNNAFEGKVLTFHKIESVTTQRTQRMSCNPTTGQEVVKLTINYTNPLGNGDGYNVQVDKLAGGSYTQVGAYAAGERTIADIPGTGVGTITLPYETDDIVEYRIILLNKKTKCKYTLPTHYRMVKSAKPRVNLVLTEGGCGDQTTPPPATIDLTFRVEVEGGDFEANGYDYTIRNAAGTFYTGHSNATEETAIVTVPVAAAPANAVTPFEVVVKVTDSECEAIGTTQVVRPARIIATSKVTHAITYCGGNSNNDGEITVTVPAAGGWGSPYQYQIVSNGVGRGWTDELTFGNLGEGSHYVQVKDAKGCLRNLDTFTFVQFNPATMQLNVPAASVVEVPSCAEAQDGILKLAGVTGGNITTGSTPIEGKLSYELFDAETNTSLGRILPDDNAATRGTVTFTDLGAGNYFIRVYSDMLCADDHKDTDPIRVGDPGNIIARAYLSKYPGCTQEGGITVEIDKRPEMRASRATYEVKLYDITEAIPEQVGGTPVIKSGTDARTGITYEFSTGVKHAGNRGNVARKYRVEIKDNNGSTTPPPAACIGTSNIVYVDKVEQLDGALVDDKSELSLKCFGSSYGKITVTASGGKADEAYSFKLLKGGSLVATGSGTSSSNPNPQGVFEGLSEGNYVVEISQAAGGCNVKTIPVTITQETEYKVEYEVKDVSCNGDKNGKIVITHTVGRQHKDGTDRKLTYAISPRLDRFLDKPGGVIDSLAPGKYFVIVQDENGCRPNEIFEKGNTTATGLDIIEFTIGEPETLSVTVNPEYTEHESCLDAKDGKTRLRVFGGTPVNKTANDNEYKLSIDGNAAIAYHTRDNGDLITGLSAGEHTFLIEDKNGCKAEASVTIEKGSDVKLQLTAGKYECVDGVIKWVVNASVTPTTAALNVRYLLTEVGTTRVDQPHDNAQFNLDVDLTGGTTKTYIISVLHKVAGHGECRVDSEPIKVAPKEKLSIDPVQGQPRVSCHDSSDGAFEITARGGSGKYEYGLKKADGSFDWQGTNNRFTGLKVGSYTVGVKDTEYNCIVERSNIAVEAPERISIKQQSIQHVGCKGETNGKISYVIEGGNTPYKWEVYKEDGTTTSKRGTGVRVAVPFDITDLGAGKYVILVTDAKDCQEKKEFEIIEGVDLGGRIVQSYDCHASIDENNKVLVAPGGSGLNSDTAAEATYDVYVSVNTPYLVVNPSVRGAANRLRYAIGVEGGTTPIQRYEFEGTTREGSDNTHNMYQIKHASLIPKLNAARTLQEGLNQYKIYLYYFDKDNPTMSDAPLCESVRDLNIEYYPPVKITNTSISNDLNLLKVKVEGGRERYTVYFSSAQYHTAEEAKSHYVQKVEDVKAGEEVTYFVQKTDYEEENPATGKVEKKIRVYVEDSKGELKEENGGKEACGHSVFMYKEFMDVVIPNYFTPNGDGQYDTWAPLNLASYPNAETVIYDRYGRKIATLSNKEEWDGTYGGEALPTGDYWFILRLNEPDDNRTFKGHFTLYR